MKYAIGSAIGGSFSRYAILNLNPKGPEKVIMLMKSKRSLYQPEA